jgi:hypothetical protein
MSQPEWLTKRQAAIRLAVSLSTIERRGVPWQDSPRPFKIRVRILQLDDGGNASIANVQSSHSRFKYRRVLGGRKQPSGAYGPAQKTFVEGRLSFKFFAALPNPKRPNI